MGLLSDFTAYVDSLKRRGANTARELVADPMGLLGRNVSAFSESLPAAPGEPQNEMLARPGMQDWATGVAMNAPTMGLLGTTKPPLKPIGDGLFGDDVGNVFRKFSTPKNTLWAVGRIDDRGGWVPYAPELKFHESLDAARAGIRADKASARAFDAAQKYNAIPNNWTGESRKIAKKLIDNYVPIDAFAASSQSKSKYITLADGRKLRISNHDLPLGYDAPDIDFRLGGDVDYLIKQILERE